MSKTDNTPGKVYYISKAFSVDVIQETPPGEALTNAGEWMKVAVVDDSVLQSMEALEIKFEKGQQELIEMFKKTISTEAAKVISDLYTDVSMYATGDAYWNYYEALKKEFRERLIKDVLTGNNGWAESIREDLLTKHKEQLQTSVTNDLLQKVDNLKSILSSARYL